MSIQWFNVNDEMPVNGGDYLVYAHGQWFIAEYFNVSKTWMNSDARNDQLWPTHWACLAEPS